MRLTLTASPTMRINAEMLTPDHCNSLSAKQLAKQTLPSSEGEIAMGDLFEIEEDSSKSLLISGDCEQFDYVGAKMKEHQLKVEGSVGDYAAANLEGGQLEITGNVGHYTACSMSGGTVIVEGDAGDATGGASIGAVQGMSGGTVLIMGDAGDRTANLMRRGLIVVRDNNGDYGAAHMKAGNLVVLKQNGSHCAYAMHRGTVLLGDASSAENLGDTFITQPYNYNMDFLILLYKHISQLAPALQNLPRKKLIRRYIGDLAVGGKGEVLVPYA